MVLRNLWCIAELLGTLPSNGTTCVSNSTGNFNPFIEYPLSLRNNTAGANSTAGTSSPNVSKGSAKSSSRLGVELGVGLGMLALVASLIGLGYWNLRRNGKRKARADAISLDDLKP
jgi:hypothetical protein